MAKHLEQADTVIKEKAELLLTLSREEEKLRADMDKVYRLYMADQISAEGFGRQYRPLEERLKQLEDEIPRLQGELDFLKIRLLSSDEVLSEARDLYGHWGKLTAEEKRKIVENITDKITVGEEEIAIDGPQLLGECRELTVRTRYRHTMSIASRISATAVCFCIPCSNWGSAGARRTLRFCCSRRCRQPLRRVSPRQLSLRPFPRVAPRATSSW